MPGCPGSSQVLVIVRVGFDIMRAGFDIMRAGFTILRACLTSAGWENIALSLELAPCHFESFEQITNHLITGAAGHTILRAGLTFYHHQSRSHHHKSTMLLKVDCLPNAVGKQPSIPLIYLGRKWTLKLLMMMQHLHMCQYVAYISNRTCMKLLILCSE